MNGPFRAEREKIFFDPFLDISSRFWGKFFFMKISENPDPFPEGNFSFRFFFFFFSVGSLFPPLPQS